MLQAVKIEQLPESIQDLIEVIGLPGAAAIRAARENEIIQSVESNATLARRYGYTERGIRKLKRRVDGSVNDLQRDLFFK